MAVDLEIPPVDLLNDAEWPNTQLDVSGEGRRTCQFQGTG